MKRDRDDPTYVDAVFARYIRRRDRVQQREKAVADLNAAWEAEIEPLKRALIRVGRWLEDRGDLGVEPPSEDSK